MSKSVIHEVMQKSQRGEMTFPEVVQTLLGAGVESYFVDFASGIETVYMDDGRTSNEKLTLGVQSVARDFSEDALIAAIRGAQADRIRYPEFVAQAAAAGVIGYWAFLTGKQVIYFGRKGESHIERFPQ